MSRPSASGLTHVARSCIATKRLPRAWQLSAAMMALLVTPALTLASAEEVQVPVIKGEIGPCTADFLVTDAENKPLYDAKIQVTVRYGFMSKRKADLEIGTNSDGKARFEGLPQKTKRPLEFQVRHGELTTTVMHSPQLDCQAEFSVTLAKE